MASKPCGQRNSPPLVLRSTVTSASVPSHPSVRSVSRISRRSSSETAYGGSRKTTSYGSAGAGVRMICSALPARTSAPGRPRSRRSPGPCGRRGRRPPRAGRARRRGERLQADGAGTRVQVEDALAVQRAPEQGLPGGEQALARTVGGGAGAGSRRDGQSTSAGLAGDHAGHFWVLVGVLGWTNGVRCQCLSPSPGTAPAPRPAVPQGPCAARADRSAPGRRRRRPPPPASPPR